MILNLYRIPGINREDTPYFNTYAERERFLQSKLIATLDVMYYPPLYENKIRLSTSVLNPFVHIQDYAPNYLSISVGSESLTYFYFIDSINYINEDLFEYSIIMDTLQTYFFDIHVDNAIVERCHIPRWVNNGNKINRDYIRENFSKSDLLQMKKTYLSTIPYSLTRSTCFDNQGRYIGPWVVAYITKFEHPAVEQTESFVHDIFINDNTTYFDKIKGTISTFTMETAGIPIVTPLYNIGNPYQLDILEGDNLSRTVWAHASFTSGFSWSGALGGGDSLLSTLVESPYVHNIFVIRYLNPEFTHTYFRFDNSNILHVRININRYGATYNVSSNTIPNNKAVLIGGRINIGPAWSFPLYSIPNVPLYTSFTHEDLRMRCDTSREFQSYNLINLLSTNYNIAFEKNSNSNVFYRSKFIPCMFDENYITVAFGTINVNVTYPLHKLDTFIMSATILTDLTSGTYVYGINNGSSIDEEDYTSMSGDGNTIQFTMLNDVYKEYVATNNMRWKAAARADTAQWVSIVASVALKSFGMYASNQKGISSLLSNKDAYTKKGTMRASTRNQLARISRDYEYDKYSMLSKSASDIHLGQGWNVYHTEKNNQYAPQAVQSMGNVIDTGNSGISNVFFVVNIANDFEYCAYMYHLYGNLVMKDFQSNLSSTTMDRLIEHFRGRKYFNYIKCNYIDFSSILFTFPEYVREDLILRYTDGIRFWNIYDDDGNDISGSTLTYNIRYDNVETK